jgi:hypothetical protein
LSVESFEATVTQACAISTIEGHVRLKAGRYRVTVLQGARGETGGAELVRTDLEDSPWPIRLKPAQWQLLDGTRHFERT